MISAFERTFSSRQIFKTEEEFLRFKLLWNNRNILQKALCQGKQIIEKEDYFAGIVTTRKNASLCVVNGNCMSILQVIIELDKVCVLESIRANTAIDKNCTAYSVNIHSALESNLQKLCIPDKQLHERLLITISTQPTILGINATNTRNCLLRNELTGLLRYRFYRLTGNWPQTARLSNVLYVSSVWILLDQVEKRQEFLILNQKSRQRV